MNAVVNKIDAKSNVTKTTQKGSDIIALSLEKAGVKHVFGYPGGGSMDIYHSLTHSQKITTVLTRNENAAVFAASGYAKATGEVGVCMAASGAGATNIITGIMDAKKDSIPLVALTGQVPTSVIGQDAFQESQIFNATWPCVKHSYLVTNAKDIPRIIKEAFHIANTGRKGPVLIDFPKDVQQQMTEPNFSKPIARRGYVLKNTPAKNQIKKAIAAIKQAKKPVLYIGGGVMAAAACDELKIFAETTGIPVATTLRGIGCFSESHELSLHMVGKYGAVYANMAVNNADLVIVLGARFDDFVIGNHESFCANAKIIHVDIDPSEINKVKNAHIPIQGDAKLVLDFFNQVFTNKLSIDSWVTQVKKWKKKFAHQYVQPKEDIVPQDVIKKLKKVAPDDIVISVGVGQYQLWTAQLFGFEKPHSFVNSSGLAAKGFGLPAAIGAKTAFTDKLVVDIEGDGNFLMNVQELQTLKTGGIPIKCIVFNNQHLGMVAVWENENQTPLQQHKTYLGDTDFVALANVFGIHGESISKTEQIEDALKRMIDHPGPFVLDVKIPYHSDSHGHVIPMIPHGGSYLDTILWDGRRLGDVLE